MMKIRLIIYTSESANPIWKKINKIVKTYPIKDVKPNEVDKLIVNKNLPEISFSNLQGIRQWKINLIRWEKGQPKLSICL